MSRDLPQSRGLKSCFSTAGRSQKDSSKKWDDLWPQLNKKHVVELTNGENRLKKTEEDYPRSLRTSSLTFELKKKEIEGQVGNHHQVR